MKFLKMIVLSFLALLLVTVRSNPLQGSVPYTVEELEESCVRQGGVCRHVSDCDPDNIVQMRVDLCPKQHHLGVSCCYL